MTASYGAGGDVAHGTRDLCTVVQGRLTLVPSPWPNGGTDSPTGERSTSPTHRFQPASWAIDRNDAGTGRIACGKRVSTRSGMESVHDVKCDSSG